MTSTNGNGAMRLFEHEGSSLYLHSGNPIKERIAKDVVLRMNPQLNEADLSKMIYAGFWIMEGSLGAFDIDLEKYPNLNQYLKAREMLTILQRWELYIFSEYSSEELDLLRLAYDATRSHLLETMQGVSDEEKKSD